MRQWFKAIATATLAAAALTPAVIAAKKTAVKEPRLPKNEYAFKVGFNPTELLVYSNAFFPRNHKRMVTPRGQVLVEVGKKDTITDMAMSPAGNTFIAVYKTKNKSVAEVWSLEAPEPDKKFEASNKKLGNPTAGAYTPEIGRASCRERV